MESVFTRARQLSLSWARSIQSKPYHLISWRSSSILAFHLRLGLPTGLFPRGLLTKFLNASLLSRLRATCPVPLLLLVLITRTIFGYGYTKVLVMQSPPVLILVYNLKCPLPSTSLPVYYSPFKESFDPILSELASAPWMLHSSPTSIIHPLHSVTPIEMVLIVRLSVRLFRLGNR